MFKDRVTNWNHLRIQNTNTKLINDQEAPQTSKCKKGTYSRGQIREILNIHIGTTRHRYKLFNSAKTTPGPFHTTRMTRYFEPPHHIHWSPQSLKLKKSRLLSKPSRTSRSCKITTLPGPLNHSSNVMPGKL